ncbi:MULTISPECIES: DUF5131 family protein [Acidithiobacillus]|uniref:DUF5131 family protein n=2 Tax=Acidithiobacillus TaxID=119977 RepID=A0A179BNN9_ACIFR|nr:MULTISPECIES: DUF5131 family protein [Acidithiobacillus]MEB8485790.1 DUF5131 family protein [Acidithiobacillus ferriphilus]MEB8490303.1 DUF5131 family protein [Acidithiobacillus ferriphilus]MEB8492988.1 DUF5131 family protein [Acidithiobacillus ferriphilus]MEB8512821.1 DUF5131 family protein [Acidithiobacillus ferriphilus]MEB8522276.1 DUF5131 family protein [Acidithiobacillus ferriphilus]
MGDIMGIPWTDRAHNEWWGCSSKAGAGCDRCYAAVLDRRTGGNYFGIGTSPRLTKEQNRNKPHKWNRDAEAAGKHVWVFCGSMMDFFDFTGEKFVNELLPDGTAHRGGGGPIDFVRHVTACNFVQAVKVCLEALTAQKES